MHQIYVMKTPELKAMYQELEAKYWDMYDEQESEKTCQLLMMIRTELNERRYPNHH